MLTRKQIEEAFRRLEARAPKTRHDPLAKEDSDLFRALVSCLLSAQSLDSNTAKAKDALFTLADEPETILALSDARIAAAFQNLGASKLWKSDSPLDQDVIVCGDDADAKRAVMELSEQIRGVRAVDGGPLAASHFVEGITTLLIGVNKRYKATTGVRIAGLP